MEHPAVALVVDRSIGLGAQAMMPIGLTGRGCCSIRVAGIGHHLEAVNAERTLSVWDC
jgi:hypothetical protein